MEFKYTISIHQLANLQDIPAIYAVVSPSQGILYVGKTKNLRLRWQRHHRLEQVKTIDPNASLAWFICEPHLQKQTEEELIQKYKPPLNGSPILEEQRVPVERVLKETLIKMAPYIGVFGLDIQESPTTVVIKYFGTLEAGISSRLRSILKGKWLEFVKRKDASWWRFKCNSLRFELGPWLYEDTPTRIALNSSMATVLREKYFPNQTSIDYDKWKAISKQKRAWEENVKIIQATNEGIKLFPLQAKAVIRELATIKVLALTQEQLTQINLDLEPLTAEDPMRSLGK
ncbi:GIY-YIG nuclease family protein [Trichothermofontia sp.]